MTKTAQSDRIFEGVVFFLNDDLSPELNATLKELLVSAGGQAWEEAREEIHAGWPHTYRFDPGKVTHVITATLDMPEYESCVDPQADGIIDMSDVKHAIVVDPEWVQRSYTLGERQHERIYSPDPARIFSGVVIHASRMPKLEVELIMGAVHSLGGSYKLNLTKEVTHLITPSEDSSKLAVLREPANRQLGIRAVHPMWIDESVKFNRLIDPAPFTWPLDRPGKPPVLLNTSRQPPYALPAPMTNGKSAAAAAAGPGLVPGASRADRAPFTDVLASITSAHTLFNDDPPTAADEGEKRGPNGPRLYKHKNVLQGKAVYYAKNPREKIAPRALDVLAFKVTEHGGRWIAPPSDDKSVEQAVKNADIVVAQYRDLPAAYFAFYHGKQLASLAWLWTVMTSGRMVSPLASLIHFPHPSKPIAGFEKHVVTISNYTGENRAYLKLLLRAMGAQWTPEMSIKNTICVSATLSGDKVLKAAEWEIPVVNHLWLEDCFARWSNVPHGATAYTDYSPSVNMQKLVGGSRIDIDQLKPWVVQAEEYTRKRNRSQRAADQPDLYLMDQIIEELNQAKGGRKGKSTDADGDVEMLGQPEAFETAGDKVDETIFIDVDAPRASGSRKPRASQASTAAKGKGKGGRKSRAADSSDEDEDDEPVEKPAPKKATKAKPRASQASAKGRASKATSKDDDEGEAEVTPAKKRGRPSTASSKRGVSADPTEDGEEADDVKPRAKKQRASAAGPARYYATTKCDLEPAQVRGLVKLGWSRTDDTKKMEVLVAGNLNRSEKTLIAIAKGLPIVGMHWVEDCVKEGEDRDPFKYILKDKDQERVRKLDLGDVLKRTRNNPSSLLKGHTFYITSKVKPEANLLRAIVTAAGGKAPVLSAIDVELLLPHPDTSHLISCNEDKRIWDPVTTDTCVDGSKVRVWEPELILDGVLKQKMQWEKWLLHG